MLVRQRDVLIWVILFPLALATLFHVMLSNIDESYRVDPASCVVVADDNFNSERAVFFREMLDEVSAPGAGQLLDVAKVATLEEGREAVLSGDAAACITVDEEGLPSMQVSPLAASLTTGSNRYESVVRAVLDQYRQIYAEMKQTFLSQPSAQGMQAPPSEGELAEFARSAGMSEAASAFMSDAVRTQQVDVLRVQASSTVRYYYALMGFAALMSITVSINAVSAARANTSAIGARRQVSGVSPAKQLAVAMAASLRHGILLPASGICLYALRAGRGIRWTRWAGDACACRMRAHVDGVGRGNWGHSENLRSPGKRASRRESPVSVRFSPACMAQPSMQLADRVSQSAPWAVLVNPAAQAANAFYDLTYYDSLAPFFATLCVLAVMAAVFFVVAALLMRRQNYERL